MAICRRLEVQLTELAERRARATAGSSMPINTTRTNITTSSSTIEKPDARERGRRPPARTRVAVPDISELRIACIRPATAVDAAPAPAGQISGGHTRADNQRWICL